MSDDELLDYLRNMVQPYSSIERRCYLQHLQLAAEGVARQHTAKEVRRHVLSAWEADLRQRSKLAEGPRPF